MTITQNYAIPVYIGNTERLAVFYETDKGEFDLRYGWAKYTSRLHSSLESAKKDFLEHLKEEYPQQILTLRTERRITEDEAKRLSPSYKPPCEEE